MPLYHIHMHQLPLCHLRTSDQVLYPHDRYLVLNLSYYIQLILLSFLNCGWPFLFLQRVRFDSTPTLPLCEVLKYQCLLSVYYPSMPSIVCFIALSHFPSRIFIWGGRIGLRHEMDVYSMSLLYTTPPLALSMLFYGIKF